MLNTRGKRSLTFAISITTAGVAFGCSSDTQKTDLRPEGPPEVLAVMVSNEPTTYGEEATFCKLNDAKRPGEVGLIDLTTLQVCDDDLTKGATEVSDADPMTWHVRIMFDELLDPSVEALLPILDSSGMPTGESMGSIKDSHPVTLTCAGKDIPYDGYYSPAGNRQTWPLGPSLVIIPDDATTVPTGTECTVTIGDAVTDKDHNQVPTDQRGPFTFAIAPIMLTATDPPGITDDPSAVSIVAPDAPFTLSFNAEIDPTTLTTDDIDVFRDVADDCTGGTALATADITLFQMQDDTGDVADPQSIQIADATATDANPTPADPTSTGNMFEPSTTYRVEIKMGASISDLAGGTADLTPLTDDSGNTIVFCFVTDAAM